MYNPSMLRTTIFALAVAATNLQGQAVRTEDKGSFTITINGTRAGREEFTISSTPVPSGTEFVSHAAVSYGDRRLRPRLRSDSAGRPSLYEIDVRGTSGATERWMGGIVRGRVTAKMETARGTSEREYVVAEGALLLDDEVYHQYYFVLQRASKGSVPIVIPRRNAQMTLTVGAGSAEKVTVGGVELAAMHHVLTEPAGTTREVWVDATGRVLKVTIPSKGIVVLRDDPPSS